MIETGYLLTIHSDLVEFNRESTIKTLNFMVFHQLEVDGLDLFTSTLLNDQECLF